MATITASMVNELRARTGQGMMECKKILVETDGDLDAAVDVFRKRGVKAGVASRAATEGRVYVVADGTKGAAVEVLCNTDFTARSEPVASVAEKAARKLLADASADLAGDAEIKNALVEVSQQTGENVTLGRAKTLAAPAGGKIGSFLYSVTNKIGVLVAVDGPADAELLNDLCLHITAAKPVAAGLTRESVPADLVEKEKALAVEQALATGKPQQIAEKIAEGKMASFYSERVLGEQPFINPDKFKGSVGKMLEAKKAKLVDYVRLEVGA